LWHGEVEFVETLIEQDLRNNSAWNQRWYAVHRNPLEPINKHILQRELEYSMQSILLVANNESSWNYLRGLARFHPELQGDISKRVEKLLTSAGEEDNTFALSLLAELREKERTVNSLLEAEHLVTKLISCDAIRAKSWIRRGNTISQAREDLMNSEIGLELETAAS
jgi:protein farnesyltransferase/geranylgeranyltransferase type-1 subunit alpha